MPLYCCVPLCTQKALKDASGNKVSFFAFPSDPDVRKRWVVAIKRDEGKNFRITKYTKLCSLHFHQSDYLANVVGSRRYLKQEAVPSVFAFNVAKKPPRKKPRERQPPPAPAARKCSVGDDMRSDALADPASEDAVGDAASREDASNALDDLAGEDVVGEETTREGAITDTNTSTMGDITGHALANVDSVLNDGATIGPDVDRGSCEIACPTAEQSLSDCLHMRRLQDLEQETASQATVIQDLELELQSYKDKLKRAEDTLSESHSELHHALSKCKSFDDQEKELHETKRALFKSQRELELTLARCNRLEAKACKKFSIECFKDRPADVQFYTGLLSHAHFMSLWRFLAPGEDGENIKIWSATYSENDSNAGRRPLLSSKEQLFLVLVRFRLGLFERDLAYRFRVSLATVSKICITWINYIYIHVGQLSLWLPRTEIDDAMPPAFKDRYPSTRVILDATEIKCEASSSLALQSATFSQYKATNTFKRLIGISPDGTVTFVSELFTGSISDKECVERSGFLKLSFDDGDSVMADKGFKIEDLLQKINVKLNIPPFLRKGHFTDEEVQETEEIASLRIHVERRIQRIKNFHIFDKPIPISIAPVANEMWAVCAVLTNLQSPLIRRCNDEPISDDSNGTDETEQGN